MTTTGVLLLALTGAAWGLYTAAGRTGADPRVATTGHFVVLGAVLALPAAAGAAAGLHVSAGGLAWAVVMGAGTTAFAYVAWYACQRWLSGTSAGAVQLVIPVLTGAGAVILLGEEFSLRLVVCAVLVGAGMWLGRSVRVSTGHDRRGERGPMVLRPGRAERRARAVQDRVGPAAQHAGRLRHDRLRVVEVDLPRRARARARRAPGGT